MARKGKSFEEAVWAFAKAINNPSAKVLFDHMVPDRETGQPRQCDVWIETTVGDHWPLTIYISCKDYARKLDVGHLDTFIREKEARGASQGVCYSRKGFTAGAIAKAKANGVCCCRLYVNQPADIPEVLFIPSFTINVRLLLEIRAADGSQLPNCTCNELFDRKLNSGETVIEGLSRDFQAAAEDSHAKMLVAGTGENADFAAQAQTSEGNALIVVSAKGMWRFFKGRTEAHLVNGSYDCVTSKFHGSLMTPAIDTQSADPGPGWVEIAAADFSMRKGLCIVFMIGDKFELAVRQSVGKYQLSEIKG